VSAPRTIRRSRRAGPPPRPVRVLALALAVALAGAGAASAQPELPQTPGTVNLDFQDAELSTVIETIARATNQNFIYDDRVRGRVTIVSPEPIPVEQAYAVFESVLQVKGFTTVATPGGAVKVVPVREAKESSIETVASSRRPPNRDRFVTRLIPLNYIDAESIVNTLKPLVSKDAAMAAYQPTNTVILTESASNIRRLIAILESIDVETYKEELAVIAVEYADAGTLAEQVSEIYGAEVAEPVAGGGAAARRARRRAARAAQQQQASSVGPPVRILTDERTNSLLVLAPRQQLEEVRRLVAKLDVPVTGGGRIHVYYLNNANAEDISQTLSGLLSETGTTPTGGGQPGQGSAQAIRSAVTSLAGGISVTADPATNALIIQASQEGFNTLAQVIEKLDVERPQVSVEALIMEVDVTNSKDLGFSALLRTINGDSDFAIGTATSAAAAGFLGPAGLALPGDATTPLIGKIFKNTQDVEGVDEEGNPVLGDGSVIDGVLRLSASNGDTNVLSAPHILTSDNEEAEIRVGDNIPIISSRVQSAAGVDTADNLATSVNVERQDIGVTLRVTPQITEGDSLRLEIFQEVTQVNQALSAEVGDSSQVGVALSSRRIENTVVVKDGETVAIGGLIRDDYQDTVTKVPWLGDIPILGWLFKSTSKNLTKTNLIVFLTPRIVRTPLDLEYDTIERREHFRRESGAALDLTESQLEREADRLARAEEKGLPYTPEHYGNPVRGRMAEHATLYPVERLREIEARREEERERQAAAQASAQPRYYLQAAVFGDPEAAAETLTELIDSGHDGTLVSSPVGDTVIYEIRLGPYASVVEAKRVGEAVRRAHGLAPSVLIEPADDEPEEDER